MPAIPQFKGKLACMLEKYGGTSDAELKGHDGTAGVLGLYVWVCQAS